MTGRTTLFAFTMFLAAALSFTVQPMVGKLLLPLLGGTPAVWNTCLVFFQAALLLGYLYAHLAPPRPRLHLAVLVLPILAFGLAAALGGTPIPVVASLLPTTQDNPILPLLAVLALAAGVPFAVLASTAPLLQRWHGGGPGTYALYAASNAGSLLGLLGYPLLVEPWLALATQQWVWAVSASCCLGLIAGCAWLAEDAPPAPAEPVPLWARLHWMALAALPAALLTSVSAVLTTEVAPVPLLWVVPLGLYLISFIIVFAAWPAWAHRLAWRASVPCVLFVSLVLLTRSAEPLFLVSALHLGAFFLLCLVCHGELVRRKPPPAQLTAFYLALSAGGVLGGLAAGLLAPVVFCRAGLVEYPLALILATLVRPPDDKAEREDIPEIPATSRQGGGIVESAAVEGVREHTQPEARPAAPPPEPAFHWLDVALPAGVAGLTVCLILAATPVLGPLPAENSATIVVARVVRNAFQYALPLVAAFALVWRPWRFALALVALFAASHFDTVSTGRPLYIERNFFGSLRVVEPPDGKFVRLIHGATQHGQQAARPEGKPVPLMYYYPTGPAGRLLNALPPERRRRVGAVGLGTGALAAYARPGERWTFFEIDPAVVRIASELPYFTYLATCEGRWDIDLGDARRRLAASTEKFDVLLLDAFSSDAIPVHLLTREAMGLYLDRLAPDGVIAFHVSNRYLDLPPLLARLAEERGMAVRVDHDFFMTDREAAAGKSPSSWVAMARSEEALAPVSKDRRWQRVQVVPGAVWTDQFSNILAVWRRDEP